MRDAVVCVRRGCALCSACLVMSLCGITSAQEVTDPGARPGWSYSVMQDSVVLGERVELVCGVATLALAHDDSAFDRQPAELHVVRPRLVVDLAPGWSMHAGLDLNVLVTPSDTVAAYEHARSSLTARMDSATPSSDVTMWPGAELGVRWEFERSRQARHFGGVRLKRATSTEANEMARSR